MSQTNIMWAVKAQSASRRFPACIQPITLSFMEANAIERWCRAVGRKKDVLLPDEHVVPVEVTIKEIENG